MNQPREQQAKKELPQATCESAPGAEVVKNCNPTPDVLVSELYSPALYRQVQDDLSKYGFHMGSLTGTELFISHGRLGLSRVVPDLRAARAFLRIVEGR